MPTRSRPSSHDSTIHAPASGTNPAIDTCLKRPGQSRSIHGPERVWKTTTHAFVPAGTSNIT